MSTRAFLLALVLVCVVASTPHVAGGQSSAQNPSSLSLVAVAYQRDGVTIRNQSTKTVTGWVIDEDVQGPGRSFHRADCCMLTALAVLPGHLSPPVDPTCPIPAGAEAIIGGRGLLLFDRRPRVVGVVFDDGSYEGEVRRLLDKREADARLAESMLAAVRKASDAEDDPTRIALLREHVSRDQDRERWFGPWVEVIQRMPGKNGAGPDIRANLTSFAGYLERVKEEALRHQNAQ